jgi:hypothetical protein
MARNMKMEFLLTFESQKLNYFGKKSRAGVLTLQSQAHGAWNSFPPPPFSLLPPFF